ncbi:MAG: hypothetical protein ACJAWS_001035 [Oleiphilaceae bacterium]|jgi:hypothetical protein
MSEDFSASEFEEKVGPQSTESENSSGSTKEQSIEINSSKSKDQI